MPEMIFYIFVLFLSIIGLMETLRYITYLVLVPRNAKSGIMLLPLKNDDAEIRLRAAVEKVNLFGAGCYDRIVAVDCGMSEETLEICKDFISGIDMISLVDESGLKAYIGENCFT